MTHKYTETHKKVERKETHVNLKPLSDVEDKTASSVCYSNGCLFCHGFIQMHWTRDA